MLPVSSNSLHKIDEKKPDNKQPRSAFFSMEKQEKAQEDLSIFSLLLKEAKETKKVCASPSIPMNKDFLDSSTDNQIDTGALPPPLFQNFYSLSAENCPAIEPIQLSGPILELFERLGGILTYVDQKGVQETTVMIEDLNSPLKGTQIVIKEYSTCPKKFNIELIGHPEAMALLENCLPALFDAFSRRTFRFSIGRIDCACHSAEKSSLKRVQKAGEKLA